ncbi:hypothetical protein E0485_05870 [Paenibacillus albiflavus]|uniref:Uncharacterized protein n=1 Tax=Paenibacillus albiflavus TaxID=2545760 RepID=A0A4R4EM36_9BACL|nr:hypothetical protein [Paenibacillus albiflavus]TCZ79388.1 hypothetical protein E0485_05870 [Paenibacillus albiflavus]
MIEVRTVLGNETKQLWIKGNLIQSDDIEIYGNNDFWVSIIDGDLSLDIMQNKVGSLSTEIRKLSFYYPLEFWDLIEGIVIRRDYRKKQIIYFEYEFKWDFEKWKKSYSIEEFAKVMEHVTAEYKEYGIYWIKSDEVISNGCSLRCNNFHEENSIYEIYLNNIDIIEDIYNKASVLLLTNSVDSTVVSIFDFPEEVKVACEQYLIYFVQFLKEIGIDAEVNLKEESGKVLFSVVPSSRETALERIRDALNIYLQLPIVINNVQYNPIQTDPNVQQLMANVHHLNSQLMLSRAIIQTNQLTIGNQQKLIEQQQKVIDSSILLQSLIEIRTNEDEGENIFGGTVKLQKYEGNGFQVDIPNLYRWVKDKLGFK